MTKLTRCPKHGAIQVGRRKCEMCVEEAMSAKPIPPLGRERLVDDAGNAVPTEMKKQ